VTLHVVRFNDPTDPVTKCHICGAEFYVHEHRKRVAHVNACWEKNGEAIEQAQVSRRDFFSPEKMGTKDIEDWLAREDASGESNADKVKRKGKRLT
jgi:hypothetical protein